MSAKSYGTICVFGQARCSILGTAGQKHNAVYGLAFTYQTMETLNLGAQIYGNTTPAAGVPGELASGTGPSDINLCAGVTGTLGPTPPRRRCPPQSRRNGISSVLLI